MLHRIDFPPARNSNEGTCKNNFIHQGQDGHSGSLLPFVTYEIDSSGNEGIKYLDQWRVDHRERTFPVAVAGWKPFYNGSHGIDPKFSLSRQASSDACAFHEHIILDNSCTYAYKTTNQRLCVISVYQFSLIMLLRMYISSILIMQRPESFKCLYSNIQINNTCHFKKRNISYRIRIL